MFHIPAMTERTDNQEERKARMASREGYGKEEKDALAGLLRDRKELHSMDWLWSRISRGKQRMATTGCVSGEYVGASSFALYYLSLNSVRLNSECFSGKLLFRGFV